MEAKRFYKSIIGITEIACLIGSKFSALLCRYSYQQVYDARGRVPQRSKFGGWLTAGAGYVSAYTSVIDCLHHTILPLGLMPRPGGLYSTLNIFEHRDPPSNLPYAHSLILPTSVTSI
jgi:hypothetical protein